MWVNIDDNDHLILLNITTTTTLNAIVKKTLILASFAYIYAVHPWHYIQIPNYRNHMFKAC